MWGEKPKNEESTGEELAKQERSHRSGENDRQRSSERQKERQRRREMETMKGETKQVAWVIAWGI